MLRSACMSLPQPLKPTSTPFPSIIPESNPTELNPQTSLPALLALHITTSLPLHYCFFFPPLFANSLSRSLFLYIPAVNGSSHRSAKTYISHTSPVSSSPAGRPYSSALPKKLQQLPQYIGAPVTLNGNPVTRSSISIPK